jgi:hypothetical protein
MFNKVNLFDIKDNYFNYFYVSEEYNLIYKCIVNDYE